MNSTLQSLVVFVTAAFATLAQAETQCTTQDKALWQDPAKFQAALAAQGYVVKTFKQTHGNCYEIYGFDKDRNKVEIYFDPVSGQAVKTKRG